MSDVNFRHLSVLVADDFSNFRSTVTSMLNRFGVTDTEAVATGEDVLVACRKRRYDLILCDYELGEGRNGQQVLEELRFRGIIDGTTLFVMVSADATKDAVMCAYDCEPDDYLMKPITAKILKVRVKRLLDIRQKLMPAHKALANQERDKAIRILIDLSLADHRSAMQAQKLLGEQFIAAGDYSKAEKLYTKALEVRQVDWARLGLCRVKLLKGELEAAGEWLEQIVQDNPLYLPAYDVIAQNWHQQGDQRQVQAAVQRSVNISPKSILRQKHLADVSERNGDLRTALNALRATMRLGQLSCHASANDHLNFARVSASAIQQEMEPPELLAPEAFDAITQARQRFNLSNEEDLLASAMDGVHHAALGHREKAMDAIAKCGSENENESLDMSLARVALHQALGEEDKAKALIEVLIERYEEDQDALERIDALLPEPVSEQNRAFVTSINAEGIQLYNQQHYELR